jgi:hypothetical protein
MPQQFTEEYFNGKHSQLKRLIEMLLHRIERRRSEIQQGTGDEMSYFNTYRVISGLINRTYNSLLDELDVWFPDQCGIQMPGLSSPTKVGYGPVLMPSLSDRAAVRRSTAAAAAGPDEEDEEDEDDDDDIGY